MASIREMYSMSHQGEGGIEGYHVDKKYVDPVKLKQQRILEASKDRIVNKPPPPTKKPSFIDEVQKNSAKFPGPCNYHPQSLEGKSKTEGLPPPPSQRKTIFDELAEQTKKRNYPGAGLYDKVVVDVDKSKLRGDISKADNSNYIDSSMRFSLDGPGVGEYNSYHGIEDHRAIKWMEKKGKTDKTEVKLPPVGTYTPVPVAFTVFDRERKKAKSVMSKEERFKKDKKNAVPFYEVTSDWGMADKRRKKDILSRISSPSSNRSVYR